MKDLITVISSAFLSLIFVPFFIKLFMNKKIGQVTREEGPSWHEVKTGTPTMGGTVFILVSLVLSLIFAVLSRYFDGSFWMVWLALLLFGGIGFIDDFIAVFHQKNEGLTARQKFLAQIAFSGIIALIGWLTQQLITIPLFAFNIQNYFLITIFMFVWITGFSNAVNLTDGLDGLATGLNIIAYLTYYFIAKSHGYFDIALICLIVVGALSGFLIYNVKPAKIFMGDVGSLALGAGLAVISIVLNKPWSLLLIGLVFVLETLSVIIQVISFKTTGKRVFKMSPIHHHFEMSGWSELKVVYVFWSVGAICAIISLILFT